MSLFPKDRDLTRSPDRVELHVSASDLRLPIEEVEVRLDAFLVQHLSWRSRSSIQKLIEEGQVLVDPAGPDHRPSGRLEVEKRSARRLKHGAVVVVVIPDALRLEQQPAAVEGELRVLYEDDEVLAVDKPPMMAVHPSGRFLTGTLIQRVHARYRRAGGEEPAAGERLPIRLCHRLDRETSGIVLVAKDPESHPRLMAQFEDREVEKEYLAIVVGEPDREGGTIDLPLGTARASQVMIKMAVREDGMPSRTDWKVVERREGCALVLCRLHTGRQHQIRVHMASIGYPLVGDKLYGPDEQLFLRDLAGELGPEDLRILGHHRQALHAHRLAFTAPKSGKRIEVESPLADDLAAWLAHRPPVNPAPPAARG